MYLLAARNKMAARSGRNRRIKVELAAGLNLENRIL